MKIIKALKQANYGTFKVWTNRMRANLSFLQFLMVIAIYFESVTFHWWHLLFVIGFLLLSIYDNDKGFVQEIEYGNKKNRMFMEVYKKIMES